MKFASLSKTISVLTTAIQPQMSTVSQPMLRFRDVLIPPTSPSRHASFLITEVNIVVYELNFPQQYSLSVGIKNCRLMDCSKQLHSIGAIPISEVHSVYHIMVTSDTFATVLRQYTTITKSNCRMQPVLLHIVHSVTTRSQPKHKYLQWPPSGKHIAAKKKFEYI
ncbi:Gag-Pol polyprotein [Schistosoma japonicum]|uniref:Gag-Pol polyprotein n=1 Tax=Schistosoma japonicum TaxID=6182 RepID=A0A4Z2D849_SCHJA|nr:Gag-Pol polyprotein [Schistosoma japonicum]